MKVTAMLCDFAAVADGKLYVSGGGWTATGTPTNPTAIAVIFEVPWERTNQRIKFDIRLINADDQPVVLPGSLGADQPIVLAAELEVGRPAGAKPGSEFNVPFAANIPPLALAPDTRYIWVISAEGGEPRQTRLPFVTRPV